MNRDTGQKVCPKSLKSCETMDCVGHGCVLEGEDVELSPPKLMSNTALQMQEQGQRVQRRLRRDRRVGFGI